MLSDAMSVLTDWSWLLTSLVGLLTLYLVRYLMHVKSLPPGPLPLPIFGNLLELRGEKNSLTKVIEKYQRKYKDIFTLWLGSRPTIMICGWDLCHEALVSKRNDFSGRVLRDSSKLLLCGHEDVALIDFGPTWETLRKIMTTAVRKYSVSEKLADLATEVVDKAAEAMVKEGRPVDATIYTYLIIYNILASSIFGQRFELDDPLYIELQENNEKLNEIFEVGLPSDAVPLLKVFYRKERQEIKRTVGVLEAHLEKKLHEHQKTYQSGDIRDFTDAILAAREEAELEGKESLKHLTEGNMVQVMMDLFTAGTDTSRNFLQWTLLLITDQPDIQRKMQDEIDSNIGSRFPVQTDKTLCPYVSAVLVEVLRYSPLVDFTLEHKTICDTQVGGFKILKDTSCLFYIKGPQNDLDHWKEPLKFKPERFLDENGKFLNTRMTGYMPFGIGRRACPGEKLALADVFLVVTRLLQTHDFQLEGGPGSVPLKYHTRKFVKETHPYKLVVKKREGRV